MIRNIMLFAVLCMVGSASQSWSQLDMGPGRTAHKIELTPFAGYGWSSSYDIRFTGRDGKLDITSGLVYGFVMDINMVAPGAQLELAYSRQDQELVYRDSATPGDQVLSDISVEYFQIGGSFGVPQGNVFPYSCLTLGASRWNPESSELWDEWKFSIVWGLGAKVYINDHVGLRVQFRLPMTVVQGGSGLYCGPDGCYTTIGGTGVLQADVSAGIMILL